MQKYSLMVFSRYTPGMEKEYIDWYCGQHMHDLMRIPGFVGGRFYKLSENQLRGTLDDQPHRYLMIWDWETDDVKQVLKEISDRIADGRTKFSQCFDRSTALNIVCLPITEYITAEQVRGMSIDETLEVVSPNTSHN